MARQETKGRNFMKPKMAHATCELFLWLKVQLGCSVHQTGVGIICVCLGGHVCEWHTVFTFVNLSNQILSKSGSSIFQTCWTLSAFK